jgi:hypothetical protein
MFDHRRRLQGISLSTPPYRGAAVMAKLGFAFMLLVLGPGYVGLAGAGAQDRYDLPEPYLSWERAYLGTFPRLQGIMDTMVKITVVQLKEPEQDILHNRVTSALVSKMANDLKLPQDTQRLALVADLLHNIDKEEQAAVLTDAEVMRQCDQMIKRLRAAGYFKGSPRFWTDAEVLRTPKVGANRALIHHITSGLSAGRIMSEVGGFSTEDVARVQAAIVAHSTGYWYFRASIDELVGRNDAWQVVYPEPESIMDKLAHDADLISQFVPESVVPDGSKWRALAKNRWGASGPRQEAHVVYYVFQRLFDEAKTDQGRQLAREKWDVIRPELLKLMNLGPADDPGKVLGVPKAFQRFQ